MAESDGALTDHVVINPTRIQPVGPDRRRYVSE